jgi:hypothetical protein
MRAPRPSTKASSPTTPGPIPVADVEGRLSDWQAVSRPVAVEVPADLSTLTHVDDPGDPMRWSVIEDRQAI